MAESPGQTSPAIIIPVHNRRETTLACLRSLRGDRIFEWARVLVVDDGSSDGTSAAVAAAFPEVEVVCGDGSLWWTGAIEAGMRRAFETGAEILVWLNDDTFPLPGSCERLVRTARDSQAITTGQCRIFDGGPVVYGGLKSIGFDLRLEPVEGGAPVSVDAVCGNFVAVPRQVVARIGFPDGRRFPHAFGDSDYSLRAGREGIAILADPGAAAIARPNALKNYASWLLGDIRIADIWLPLFDKRSYSFAPAYSRFLARHFGMKGAVFWGWTVLKRIPITLLRLCVPRAWLRRLWGGRSCVWRREVEIRDALGKSSDPPAPTPSGAD